MTKIVKNTTASDIFLKATGVNVLANDQYEITTEEYLHWSTDALITEITPYLDDGRLVVNDGYDDLSGVIVDGDIAAVSFLRYPDLAWNIRFLSDPDRINGFVSKDVQRAIEEARSGGLTPTPTTTIDDTPTIAYTLTLTDDTTYVFDARVSVRRTDVAGETGDFQIQCRAKRESGGGATIVGNIFQERAQRDDGDWSVTYGTSGNDLNLVVTGALAKTIKWQPQVETVSVS